MINIESNSSELYSSHKYQVNKTSHKNHQSKNSNNKRQHRDHQSSKVYDQVNSRDIYDSNNDRQESDINDYSEKSSKSNPQREHMQIEIIPQDDNWGANTTAVTGDFSDFNDDMTEDGRSFHGGHQGKKDFNNDVYLNMDGRSMNGNFKPSCVSRLSKYCQDYFNLICTFVVSFGSFVTPIVFIILPQSKLVNDWEVLNCGLECEGLLIGIAFKLFILLVGYWVIFARKPRAFLPRIFELRAMLVVLLCIMTFSFWLFYVTRIIFTQMQDYHKILQFTVTYVDLLLFIFILSVFIIKVRPYQPDFVVKIVRSPDGETSEYTIGKMSIQRAAVWLLEQYYKDFVVYNPWLENIHRKKGVQMIQFEQGANKKNKLGRQTSKNYGQGDDDDGNDAVSIRSKKSRKSIVGGNFTANDRFYEEYEYERRLRKRRARLLTTTEDAFTHIKRIHGSADSIANFENGNNMPSTIMDPFEAAQAIFTSIARDLRRYLRVTRQQPYFTRGSIVAHLANCISYDMSPKSFLQRYLSNEPIIFNEKALGYADQPNHNVSSHSKPHGVNYHMNLKTSNQSWILICDTPLYQNLEDNIMFVLKKNEVCLMCTFKRMPKLNIVEDILDPKRNKFVLKLNTETTV